MPPQSPQRSRAVDGPRGVSPVAGPATLQIGRFSLTLNRPLVMGILNATPDSFSDGGRYPDIKALVAAGMAMVEAGADILDIGGESTRPGAFEVPVEDERQRVMPVLSALLDCGVPLSIDTRKPEVMAEALDMGADMINDVNGLRGEGAAAAVLGSRAAVCVMHMQGEPLSMQRKPSYGDVVTDVADFLASRRQSLIELGMDPARIVLDPGIGFGKTPVQNVEILTHLDRLLALGSPVLVGLSRKSLIGHLTGRPVNDRLAGSLAGAIAAADAGASILRVHDVAETVDALAVWQSLGEASLAKRQR